MRETEHMAPSKLYTLKARISEPILALESSLRLPLRNKMGSICHIFVSVRSRQPVRELETVVALENSGLEGSRHNKPNGKRQVLLMDIETLKIFALAPGQIKENITTRDLNLSELS